ncbi:MAG: DNA alkylation repair protein, partial [Gammaproteobacteria bacterium]
AKELLGSQFHEERLLALLLFVDKFGNGDEKVKTSIYKLYMANTRLINNWDLVDSSASQIVGVYLADLDKDPFYQLAKSKMLWERRIAIIATFHYIKHDDFKVALKISETLLTDDEDLIHKAVGWMLREIGKRNVAVEERYLKRYYKIMPRTMLRYAIEKFPEHKRHAYLKGTV